MSTAVIHYTAAAQTHRGRKRSSNEDAFGYSAEHGIYLVCDGMGGAAAGEIASSLAVDEVLSHFACRNEQKNDGDCEPKQMVEKAICAANSAIFDRAMNNQRLRGMGTTLVGLAVDEYRAWVFNVGDSRCYRLRGESFEQLTLDHSLVEEQIRSGRMSKADALRSPYRNVITRALGTQGCVTPDIFALEAEPGDLFLLCSDGLTRELADSKIAALLEVSAPLEGLCGRLIEAANKAGGHDNITCLVVRAEHV